MTDVSTWWRHRLDGTYRIDEWGLDQELVSVLEPVVALRWQIEVVGAEHLPLDGPAVVVHNRVVGASEPFVVARGLRLATGRWVRAEGVLDVAPVGPLARRIGRFLANPSERAALLRAGHVLALPLGRTIPFRRAGALDPTALAEAHALDVPVLPAAAVGWEIGRRWRILLGAPVGFEPAMGPVESAEAVRLAVQLLLERPRS